MSYGHGFDAGRYLEALATNLIFRIFGGILRLFFIIVGLIAEVFIIFAGLIIFLSWLVLPFIIIAGLILGFRLIFQ